MITKGHPYIIRFLLPVTWVIGDICATTLTCDVLIFLLPVTQVIGDLWVTTITCACTDINHDVYMIFLTCDTVIADFCVITITCAPTCRPPNQRLKCCESTISLHHTTIVDEVASALVDRFQRHHAVVRRGAALVLIVGARGHTCHHLFDVENSRRTVHTHPYVRTDVHLHSWKKRKRKSVNVSSYSYWFGFFFC